MIVIKKNCDKTVVGHNICKSITQFRKEQVKLLSWLLVCLLFSSLGPFYNLKDCTCIRTSQATTVKFHSYPSKHSPPSYYLAVTCTVGCSKSCTWRHGSVGRLQSRSQFSEYWVQYSRSLEYTTSWTTLFVCFFCFCFGTKNWIHDLSFARQVL